MATQTPFKPKQLAPKTGDVVEEIMGNASRDVIINTLTQFLPPISANATVHDNGCGTGIVTSSHLILHPHPSTLTIHATDSNQYMIDGTNAKIAAHKWTNVHTAVMRAQELTFPDNTFDLSFTNFVVGALDDPEKAAAHLYRTLKPGGKAAATIPSSMPHDQPLKDAHSITRGLEANLAIKWGGAWHTAERLKEFLISSEFKEGDIEIKETVVWHAVKDSRRWVQLLWSFLGDREGEEKWKMVDEERWEEALDIAERGILESEGVYRTEEGVWMLKFPCNVVIGTK